MKEENEGFRIEAKKANKFNGSKRQANSKGGFKVSIEGMKRRSLADDDDDDDDDDIEEDIQTRTFSDIDAV